jgi:signal peptidase I
MADRDDPRPDAAAPHEGERLFTAWVPPEDAGPEGPLGEDAAANDGPGTQPHAATDAGGTADTGGTADAGGTAGADGTADTGGIAGAGGNAGDGAGTPPPAAREHAPPSGDRPPAKGGSFLKELPVLLLIAFVLAFLLRTFVLQVFYIPSSSMEPTLQIDDRMVVEKLTYLVREPRRGEIVVFEGETFVDPYSDQGTAARVVRGVGQFLGVVPASARDFVKRVIGVEGDEIVIESGRVFVNGEPIDEPYVVFDDGSDYGPVTVPEGHLFFLGDNRPNSSDSRRSLGFVPLDHVVGRAAVIIWPFDHTGLLTGVDHDVPSPNDRAADAADLGAEDQAWGGQTVDLDVGDLDPGDLHPGDLDPVALGVSR